MMAPKRGVGRPPLTRGERSIPVSLSLPAKKFDELCAEARRQGESLPETLRRRIYANVDPVEKKTKK